MVDAIGTVHSLAYDRNGHSLLTFALQGDFADVVNDYSGKQLKLQIKPITKQRSLDCNAYCWVLIDKLAAKTGIPKREIYRNAIKEIGGVSTAVCVQEKAADLLCENWEQKGIGWQTERMPSKIDGCVTVFLYYGSSTYDAAQMKRLVDLIQQECKQQGIETKTPEELAQLLSSWNGGKQ